MVVELLDAMVVRYDSLTAEQSSEFRALAGAIVRHAREENDPPKFNRWADWLDACLEGDWAPRTRLSYERILWHQAELEIDKVETLINGWDVRGDSFWLLRKAALLADLGRDAEAAALSVQALNSIRAETLRSGQDIAAWSRESFALLFRSSILYGEFGRWLENKPIRDQFDLRQEQLQARGCPGKRDFFELVGRLSQEPPLITPLVENVPTFDLGSTNVTHNLAGVDPRIQRLLAYRALRFQEESGLPIRIGNTGVALQILSEAARWLMDVAPTRAIDAFLRATLRPSSKQFDRFLTRPAVARMTHLKPTGSLIG